MMSTLTALVHRDVSIGNTLSYDRHAKLADLEFAKKMSDSKSDEMRPASETRFTLSGKSLIWSQQGTCSSCWLK
jgi:hypothetical protein